MGRNCFDRFSSASEAPSGFEPAQDVLQTSPAPYGLVLLIVVSSPGRNRTADLLCVIQAPYRWATGPCRLLPFSNTNAGDRNRTCDLLVQSQTQRPTVATPDQWLIESVADRFNDQRSAPIVLQRSAQECHAGVEPACPGWKPGTSAARSMTRVLPFCSIRQRKERESNPQGDIAVARPFSKRLPSPIGLPFLRPNHSVSAHLVAECQRQISG